MKFEPGLRTLEILGHSGLIRAKKYPGQTTATPGHLRKHNANLGHSERNQGQSIVLSLAIQMSQVWPTVKIYNISARSFNKKLLNGSENYSQIFISSISKKNSFQLTGNGKWWQCWVQRGCNYRWQMCSL